MIRHILSAPDFWWQEQISPIAKFLQPVGMLYGKIVQYRMRQAASYSAKVPVICVGNFSVGGAGKTPTTLALAALLKARRNRPGFLLRGFGRQSKHSFIVDSTVHTAYDTGDEAMLYAPIGPTAVSKSRPEGSQLLETTNADIILLDDGLQNPSLHKDCSFAVVDAQAGLGNGLVFPAGPLRATFQQHMPYTDALILLDEGEQTQTILKQAAQFEKPVFQARTVISNEILRPYHNTPVVAYCGIGRPEKFFLKLEKNGFLLKDTIVFSDHHWYSEQEANTILKRAAAQNAHPITTTKDHVRLAKAPKGSHKNTLFNRTKVLSIKIEFDDPAAINRYLQAILSKARKQKSTSLRS